MFYHLGKDNNAYNHRLTKGELRELFVSDLLKLFLTDQFGVGSGIIVNQKGEQSKQTDILIYDKRILPPFIKEHHIGVYPAESVLATIEIKSSLRKVDILNAEDTAKMFICQIYNPESSIYKDYHYFRPVCTTFGFYGIGVKELKDRKIGKTWLRTNIAYLTYIGLLNKYSWIKIIYFNSRVS